MEVKKEGRKGIYIIEKDEIKKYLKKKKFKKIHNFMPNSSMLIGADHNIKSVLEDIDNSERIAILTGEAYSNNVNHALAIIINNKLNMFDIGEISIKDLIIK